MMTKTMKKRKWNLIEQVNEKIFAEMEQEYTYIRDMSEVVVWENYDVNAMLDKAYDNYSKSK